jgi:uncharacterized membrane protein
MESIGIETLYTIAGVVAATGLIVQVIKVLFPGDNPDAQWTRRIAVIVAFILTSIVAVANGVAEGDNVVMFWLAVVLNGFVAGLAASAAFDTLKYGTARTVEEPPV